MSDKNQDRRYSLFDDPSLLADLDEWHKAIENLAHSGSSSQSSLEIMDAGYRATHTRFKRTSSSKSPSHSSHAPIHPPSIGPRFSDQGRIQLPSTRASSRVPEAESMTDSLKLYEQQYKNFVPSDGKRPMSLCFDSWMSGVDVTGGGHGSSSSSSTMSSSSSSNSHGSSGFNVSASSDSREDLCKHDSGLNMCPTAISGSPSWSVIPPYLSQNELREDRVLSPQLPSRQSHPTFNAISPHLSRSTSSSSTNSNGSSKGSMISIVNGANPETSPSSHDETHSLSDSQSTAPSSCRVTMLPAVNDIIKETSAASGVVWERYDLSTLDLDYRSAYQVKVVDQSGKSAHDARMIDTMSESELSQLVDAFRDNRWGLTMNLLDGKPRVTGSLRIFMNLIKPIKMSLQHSNQNPPDPSTSSSSSDTPPSPLHNAFSQNPLPKVISPKHGLERPGVVSFFLPRGTPKLLHITNSTTTDEVIEILLKKFHIQESPRKFALFEHTLEEESVVLARKFSTTEQPLVTLLGWASDGREALQTALTKKRIVLQENEDSGEIDWQEFSIPELKNFLRILDKEKAEYEEAIQLQYGLMRHKMTQCLDALRQQEDMAEASLVN